MEPLSETSHALPSGARLHRREEFAATLAAGAARARRNFRLYVRPNGLSRARIGIIASRRVMPRAVDRNRMKRLVREVFRTLVERPAGVDIVVELRRRAPRGSSAAVRAELTRMLLELAAAPRGQ
ncbi:MAG: ribonuclease P protein component [Burkholderiales bacterium]